MPSYGNENAKSETVEWYTPPEVFKALDVTIDGIPFDVDVASPGAVHVPWIPALKHLTKNEDGLKAPWVNSNGHLGFVWCNPPWGGRVSFVTPSGERPGNPGVGIALVGLGDGGKIAVNRTRPHFCDVWRKE